jgi:hypothetical protein
MNPFQQVKDPVTIEMLKEVAKKNRKQPIKMIEDLVINAYRNLNSK